MTREEAAERVLQGTQELGCPSCFGRGRDWNMTFTDPIECTNCKGYGRFFELEYLEARQVLGLPPIEKPWVSK